MYVGLLFVGINLCFIFVGYLTRSKNVAITFTSYNTIIIGDLIGLSLINYVFGITYDFSQINAPFLVSSILISLLVTILLHQSYKLNSLQKSNSGYIKGSITNHGKLHLIYCFYQIVILSLLVFTLVDTKSFSYILLAGIVTYLFSVYLDIKKGILFLKI